MPLISMPPLDIEIDIPDLVVNETLSLKRKAKLFTMTYNQHLKFLVLSWLVSYPDLLEVKGFTTYSKESIADNTTMVDVNTGEILAPIITEVPLLDGDGNPTKDADGNEITTQEISYPGDYIGQYDWFNMIAETQPVKVHDMIRQYGLAVENWNK